MKKRLNSFVAFLLCALMLAGCGADKTVAAEEKEVREMISIGKIAEENAVASYEKGKGLIEFAVDYFTYDAVGLVQAYLDLYLFNSQTDEVLSVTGLSADEAEDIYARFLADELDYLCYCYEIVLESCDSSVQATLESIIMAIYANAKYELGEQYESGDDFYVEMTIYPIDVNYQLYDLYDAYAQQLNDRIDANEFSSVEELEMDWALGLISMLDEAVAQLGYLDPIETEVLVELQPDGSYAVSKDEMDMIIAEILAY